MATSAEIIGVGPMSGGTPHPSGLAEYPPPMETSTAVGQHLRVERLIRLSERKAWYIANNIGPKWSRRKCWACGNKYAPTMAKCCDYCLTPLKNLSFLMTTRYDERTFAPFAEMARLRLDHFGFLSPVAVIMRLDQMHAVYHYSEERLLLDEPAPLPADRLLAMAHALGDVLHYLHQNGVILDEFGPEHILIVPDGTARFFDPDVQAVVRPSQLFDHSVNPTRRDFVNLGRMLRPYVAPANTQLIDFFERLSFGEIDGYRAFERAMEGVILSGGARPVENHVWAYSDVGLRRAANEDRWGWAELPDKSLMLVVADGMGGHDRGEVASALAVAAVRSVLSADPSGKSVPWEKRVTEALERANSDVLQYRRARDLTMGTTAVVAVVTGNEIVVGNAGDSRAYLFHAGKLEQISRDHSIAQALVESGKLKPEEARTHPRGNILTSTVGGSDELEEFDVIKRKLHPGDRVLLCSDGLWNDVPDGRLASLLGRIEDPTELIQTLVREAYEVGGSDNLTIQLCQVG